MCEHVMILYSVNKYFLMFSLCQVSVPVYTAGTEVKPADIAKQGLKEAKKNNIDVVIMDTAGRLQVLSSSREPLYHKSVAVLVMKLPPCDR